MMLTPANFSLGTYIKTSRVTLLDNLLEASEPFITIQRRNYSNKLALYLDRKTFDNAVMYGSTRDGLIGIADVMSCETFAIGLIAMELGLMKELARKVCNTSTKTFDTNAIEQAFISFSSTYSCYPQLINIVHELVGAQTAPRHDPKYIFEYVAQQPSDLVCYDTAAPIDHNTRAISHISNFYPSESRDFGTIKEILSKRYPQGDANMSPTSSKKSEDSPITDLEGCYQANSPAHLKAKKDTSNLVVFNNSTYQPSIVNRERSTSLLANTLAIHIHKHQDIESRHRQRSKSPIISKMQASPYRGLLTPKASRSTSPAPRQNISEFKLDQSCIMQADTSTAKKRRYVNRVDVMSNNAMLVTSGQTR